MKPELIKELEQELLSEKERLERELKEFAKQNPKNATDYDANFPNLGDKDDENAEEVDTYNTNLALERTLEANLRDVVKSLERIKDGTYGICKYCGKEIGEKRMRARAASSSCIDCKKSFTHEI